jgi:hypothetical protein
MATVKPMLTVNADVLVHLQCRWLVHVDDRTLTRARAWQPPSTLYE